MYFCKSCFSITTLFFPYPRINNFKLFLYKYLKPTTVGFSNLFLVFKDTREYAYILLAIDVVIGFLLFRFFF